MNEKAVKQNRDLEEKITLATAKTIIKQALSLRPSEKAELIDKLLSSLDLADKEIDALWAKEAEDRIDAYEQGQIKAVSLATVLQKYQ